MIKQLHTIAFTHRNIDVAQIGKLHIQIEEQQARFEQLKGSLGIDELVFLSTCNRVEYFFSTKTTITNAFLSAFFKELYPHFSADQVAYYTISAERYQRMDVVNHLSRVAASIDSLVIGEREIITQVRQAFDNAKDMKLSGDGMRLLFQHAIQVAKKVYTDTKIATKPVSIVSIANQLLQQFNFSKDARVLVIGAGVTNTTMVRFLKKAELHQFTIFNRTFEKAAALAEEVGGKALPYNELAHYKGGFDILVTCTGTDHHIITPALYASLLNGDTDHKITIDLALPSDIDPEVHEQFPINKIAIDVLQRISDDNIKERSEELQHVEGIIEEAKNEFVNHVKQRAIEIAMRPVPQMVKEIKSTAFNEVFKSDLEKLDAESLEILEKVVGYMEKKYMSMPMLMAKEILYKS